MIIVSTSSAHVLQKNGFMLVNHSTDNRNRFSTIGHSGIPKKWKKFRAHFVNKRARNGQKW